MFPWNMFPFNKNNIMKQINPQDIEKQVQNMLSQFMPGKWEGMFNHEDMLKRATSMFQQNTDQNTTNSETNTATQDQQPQSTPTEFDVSVFETFDDIYVRTPIKDEEWLKRVKIYHTSNQVIIENIPEVGQRHVITLPSLIKKKGTVAQYKDEMLEIKMTKNADMQFTEVDVAEKL
ncbi:Hsp20/alpha crystallin family protein [Heyndrickxia vini]|uniref:Hsp20/alpha crystallin family protein n=2 Tax=Heyndrickxia vini TaxID=1476025 RepID=A0ABX7E5Z4_9BACI|nr:Hsp20/alpha crystallin family protein [Heyndrickxia vini]